MPDFISIFEGFPEALMTTKKLNTHSCVGRILGSIKILVPKLLGPQKKLRIQKKKLMGALWKCLGCPNCVWKCLEVSGRSSKDKSS